MGEAVMVASKGGEGSRRKAPRNSSVSVGRLMGRLGKVEAEVGQISTKMECLQKDFGIYQMAQQRTDGAIGRIESKMDAILMLVGSEEEDGEGGYKGVGLLGRMRRVEEGQATLYSKYKTWIAWGGGFASCMVAMTAILWWLISDKIELVLKGAPQ